MMKLHYSFGPVDARRLWTRIVVDAASHEEAKAHMQKMVDAFKADGVRIEYINWDVPASPIYGLQSWSRGVISFGFRVEYRGRAFYMLAEPAQ